MVMRTGREDLSLLRLRHADLWLARHPSLPLAPH